MFIPEKVCSVCSQKFSLSRNPTGLVFDDSLFVCETCCTKHSHDELNHLGESMMNVSARGMPIALWLIHEQNKDKTMMSVKR